VPGGLATERYPSPVLLMASMERLDALAPPVLALLERVATGDMLSDEEANLLFRGLHLLGTARDQRAFQPLLRFLRSDRTTVDDVLGEAQTESMPRIVAGVFDGDAETLFAAIIDRKIEEFIRHSLFMAAAFLCWAGRIERAAMIAFLERFQDEHLADDCDVTWDAWQDAIALLGLRQMAARVERAWQEDRISEMISDKTFFAEMLDEAEAAREDGTRFTNERLGYFNDIVEAFSWTASAEDEEGDEPLDDAEALEAYFGGDDMEADAEAMPSATVGTVTNPMRHLGRNDPCPCGSGKKAKRCCLTR
jgi:hypothetical protein